MIHSDAGPRSGKTWTVPELGGIYLTTGTRVIVVRDRGRDRDRDPSSSGSILVIQFSFTDSARLEGYLGYSSGFRGYYENPVGDVPQ